jgi:LmbE family N-acetylglucosaminyl deacetylase
MKRILVVAAHPDDEVLGCGGTIARARDDNADVRVVFLAEGVTSRYDFNQINSPEVLAASQQRNANAIAALAVLGVPENEIFLSQRPCCRLDQVPLLDLTKQIEQHLRDFRPDTVFTHAAHDPNVDHRSAFNALLPAVRPLHALDPAIICSFEILSSTEWNPTAPFPANYFVDITTSIDRKIAALAAYGAEMRSAPHPRSDEVIRSLAQFRGAQSGRRYAEGFSLIRAIAS